MTPEHEALERVRSANPVPDEEHLGGSDLTSLFATVEEKRSTMSTGMRERKRSEERPFRRRLVPVMAFTAALLLVVVGIGLVPALLRSNEEIVPADEPATTTVQQATTTTTQEPATTAAPETTVTTETQAVTPVSGEWALVHEAWGPVVGLESGGFVVAGPGDHVFWSPDGIEWLDADPGGVIEGDAGWIEHGAVIGDRVVLVGHTCEGGGDIAYEPVPCPMEVGIWVGDPWTGEWERVAVDDADLTSCADSGADECWTSADALAASSDGVVVVGSATTGPPVEQGGWLMYQTDWSIWKADADVSAWTRTDLPDPLGFGSVIWQRAADGEASGEYRYGPVAGHAGDVLMTLEVETWSADELFESFLLRSDDGGTWTVVDGAPELVRGIASDGDAVVAVGGIHSEILYRSADGETWEEVFSEGEGTWFADVTYSEQYGFVALASVPVEPPATAPGDDEMGPGDRDIDLFVSADGREWSLVGAAATTEARREPRFVAVSGDAILVAGYGSDPEGSSDEGVTGIWMLVTD